MELYKFLDEVYFSVFNIADSIHNIVLVHSVFIVAVAAWATTAISSTVRLGQFSQSPFVVLSFGKKYALDNKRHPALGF